MNCVLLTIALTCSMKRHASWGRRACVVLVEHLRDWKNFIAFGPGFVHFHSRRSWLRTIREAGLLIERESAVTPFVECFVLRRAEP